MLEHLNELKQDLHFIYNLLSNILIQIEQGKYIP